MKINLSEKLKAPDSLDDITVYCIIHAITQYQQVHGKTPALEPTHYGGTADTGNMDVTLTINGVEMDFEELLSRFQASFEDQVLKEADKRLKQRLGDGVDKLFDSIREANELFRQRLGLPDNPD